jgi:hypothetical protein
MYTQDVLQTQVPATETDERQIPEVSAGRSLILPPLQKRIYNLFQTRKDAIFETGIDSGLFHSLLVPLLQEDAEQTGRKALVVVPSSACAEALHGQASGLIAETPERIIDGLRRRVSGFQDIKRIVIACPPENACADFSADIQFIYSKAEFSPHTLVFTETLHKGMYPIKRLLSHPKIVGKKDIIILRSLREPGGVSEEMVKDFLDDARRKLYEEPPQILRMYRKLFTQSIPFFNRSAVAAYLLKLLFEKTSGVSPRFAGRRTPAHTDMRMLFFGLGKNRKVFPRDITGLILGKFPEMDKSDIGEIRILDSYSFVEVTESRAQAVIDALNGCEYRGRTLAVNYARKKEDAQ